MKKVIIFDFDGTFYSGEHIFDNIKPKVIENRRCFLPRVSDEEYAFIIKKYPEWQEKISGRDIVEEIYKIKNENPNFEITTSDFWNWQEANDYEIIFNNDELVDPKYIKSVCEKFPSYIVSNSSPSHLKRYMKKLKINENWFKEIISNHFEEFDQTKKHYYMDIMKKERVKPENVLVVGDSQIADLLPAEQLGMKTLFIKNARELKAKLNKILGDKIDE